MKIMKLFLKITVLAILIIKVVFRQCWYSFHYFLFPLSQSRTKHFQLVLSFVMIVDICLEVSNSSFGLCCHPGLRGFVGRCHLDAIWEILDRDNFRCEFSFWLCQGLPVFLLSLSLVRKAISASICPRTVGDRGNTILN